MTSLTVQVNSSSDDAYQAFTSSVGLLTDNIVTFDNANKVVGDRFTGVTIPKNATINSAYYQWYLPNSTYDTGAWTVTGQAADNPGTFTTASGDIYDRSRTTATAAVNVTDIRTAGDGHYTLVDVKTILQELVNRAGWASGNAIVLISEALTSGAMRKNTYDNNAAHGAKLVIEYTAPAAGNAKKRKLRQGVWLGARAGT